MFVLAGREAPRVAAEIANKYAEYMKERVQALYALWSLKEDSQSRRRLNRFLKNLSRDVELEVIEYEDTRLIMGTTWQLLILDLTEQLRPNDLGRLVETTAGGGLVLLLTPPIDEWPKTTTEFQKRLITYPYTEKDLRNRFIKRFVRKLHEHEGIWILDLENERVYGKPAKHPDRIVASLRIPRKRMFSEEIYNLAKTQDQIEVLRLIEPMAKPVEEKQVLVITANRGRGKSAVLGLGIAGIVSQWREIGRRRRVIVTAPEPGNVDVLFDFLVRGLEALGLEYREEKVSESRRIHVDKVSVGYMKPYEVPAKRRDMTVVDEAAGIPVPLLFRILDCSERAIYSSTIHGYEGAGRGFSVRFLKSLQEHRKISLKTYQMTEPIRYSPTDPIEKWLYDVLLLDAEPVELTELEKADENIAEKTQYYTPDLDYWFGGEGEEELRDFIGIYVLAHYRNRPDDLAILADAPHHTARALKLPNGKVVAALQLSVEGGLARKLIDASIYEGCRIHGHLIPNVLLRHYYLKRIGRLRGFRIVRIAVHPELMDRGLGSKALKHVCEEAEALKLDWVGSSFGASEQLLHFWIKNGFTPVHISPERNPVSGEYSVIVVKPLSSKAKSLVDRLNALFKVKLAETLSDVYYYLEPEIAYLLLSPGNGVSPLKLGRIERMRLKLYVDGRMVYEASADALRLLAKKYFLEAGYRTVELTKEDGCLLVAKCLQGKSWSEVAKLLGRGVARRLREVITLIYENWLMER